MTQLPNIHDKVLKVFFHSVAYGSNHSHRVTTTVNTKENSQRCWISLHGDPNDTGLTQRLRHESIAQGDINQL